MPTSWESGGKAFHGGRPAAGKKKRPMRGAAGTPGLRPACRLQPGAGPAQDVRQAIALMAWARRDLVRDVVFL